MRWFISLLWFLAITCLGCKADHAVHSVQSRDYSAQIKALESADSANDVATAIAAGDTRFVGIMGIGAVVPGAPEWVRLASPGYVRFIPNTSDAIESEQHGKLQHVAYEYARKYNEALLRKMPSLATTRPIEQRTPDSN